MAGVKDGFLESSPEHTLVRAHLAGGYFAQADIHRGIELSLGGFLENEVSLNTELGRIKGRGVLTAEARCEVRFPIDLFDMAGVIGRMEARLAAQGFIGAEIIMPKEEFRQLVAARIEHPIVRDLLAVFIDEVEVNAAFWAHGAVALQAYGRAMAAGTFLKQGARPGFTYSFGYGYGYVYGGGFTGGANLDIPNPKQLVTRLANKATERLITEINTSGVAQGPEAEMLVSAIKLLLPLATQLFYQLGMSLSDDRSSGNKREEAIDLLVDAFFREAQTQFVSALVEFGLQSLADFLEANRAFIAGKLNEKNLENVVRFNNLIETLRQHKSDVSQPTTWLPELLQRVESLSEVVPAPRKAEFDSAETLLVASALVLDKLEQWTSLGNGKAAVLNSQTSVELSAPNVRRHLKQVLDITDDEPITLDQVVEFVLEHTDWQRGVPRSSPARNDVLRVINQIVSVTSDFHLTKIGTFDRSQLVSLLAPRLEDLIDRRIIPMILVSLRNKNSEAVVLIDKFVIPTVSALSHAVIPKILLMDGTPERARAVREAVSAVILQQVQLFVTTGMDVVTDAVMTSVDEFEIKARALIQGAPGIDTFTNLIPQAMVTRQLALSTIHYSVHTARLWHRHQYPLLRQGINGFVSDVAVASDEQLRAELESYAATLARSIVLTLIESSVELLRFQFEAALAIVRQIAEDIVKAAIAAWRAAEALVALALRIVGEIVALIEAALALLREIAQRIIGLIREILDRLFALIGAVRRAIRDVGERVLNEIPPTSGPTHELAIAVYRTLFDAMEWIEAHLRAGAQTVISSIERSLLTIMDPDVLQGELEAAVRSIVPVVPALEIAFEIDPPPFPFLFPDGKIRMIDPPPVRIAFGTITFPGDRVADAMVGVVLGDNSVVSAIRTLANERRRQTSTEDEVQRLQANKEAAEENAASAQVKFDTLRPSAPTRVQMTSPLPDSEHPGKVAVVFRIEGVNATFLTGNLGMPRRVKVLLNSKELDCDSATAPNVWVIDAGGATFRADLTVEDDPTDTQAIFIEKLREAQRTIVLDGEQRFDRQAGTLSTTFRSAHVRPPGGAPLEVPLALTHPVATKVPLGLAVHDADDDLSAMLQAHTSSVDPNAALRVRVLASLPLAVDVALLPRPQARSRFVPVAADAVDGGGQPSFKAAQLGFNILQVIVTDGIPDANGNAARAEASVQFFMV